MESKVLMSKKQVGDSINTAFLESLLSGVCHDIGAPARHIVQFSQMLEQLDEGASLDEKHRRWLSIVQQSGQEIQAMLGSLSLLSRLSKLAEKVTRLELSDLFERAWHHHKVHTLAPNRQLELTFEGAWPIIVGCHEHWYQLFSHLIENAIIFQPADPHHVIHVKVTCACDGADLTLSIEDNGIGASEHQCSQMCRAFKQLNHKEDYPTAGLGMGLTYCNYIAELNGGTLSLGESHLGGLCVEYQQQIAMEVESPVPRIGEG